MKYITLIMALSVRSTVYGSDRQADLLRISAARQDSEAEFRRWIVEHGKTYLNDAVEYNERFQVWKDNLEFVHNYNSDDKQHWLGLNSLADITQEEYRQTYLGYAPNPRKIASPQSCKYCNIPVDSLPKDVDMRKKGYVTPIKNQEQCGSCWAFSATASIESINAIFGGPLVSLSEQEIMDCDTEDSSCQGGEMDDAFEFVINNRGLDTLKDYPYLAEIERCSTKKEGRHVVTIQDYQDVQVRNESALKQAAAFQVVSAAIEADQRAFQMYSGGIFDAECGTNLDHGVNVVGYGVNGRGEKYWIVRNSWGNTWGDHGYIYMKRDIRADHGICGIALDASFPIKTEPNPTPPSPPAPTPPTPPAPIQCDYLQSCPADTTCCCSWKVLGYCWEYACCPYKNAVCCSDDEHCCPEGTECNAVEGSCTSSGGSTPWYPFSQPMLAKFPAFVSEE